MAGKTGYLHRLREGLGKTRGLLTDGVLRVFEGRSRVDAAIFEDLEEILIGADLGVDTAMALVDGMRRAPRDRQIDDPVALMDLLKGELLKVLEAGDPELHWHADGGPHVTLVAGVNGSGKTTTVGKLAARLKAEGRSVMLGAADTYRAAATEQLGVWSERAGVPLVKHGEGADPASVAYDATDSAVARGMDCLLIDTAGRLHTKTNLMEELKKIQRAIGKRLDGAPHQVLLVLDSTTGQNGLQQAKQFTEALNVTGIVLTKLDGTAKGGIAVAIQQQLGISIKLIGIGEDVEDLRPFDAREFVDALFGDAS